MTGIVYSTFVHPVVYDCHSSVIHHLLVSCSLFLCLQSHSHVGVGGVEVIYDIRYSLGEQEIPDRLNNHDPLTQQGV